MCSQGIDVNLPGIALVYRSEEYAILSHLLQKCSIMEVIFLSDGEYLVHLYLVICTVVPGSAKKR